MSVSALQQQLPHVDQDILEHVLWNVAGGNMELAKETLTHMSRSQLSDLNNSIKQQSVGSLSRQQEVTVKEFIEVTNSSKETAVKFLSRNGWELVASLQPFFQYGDCTGEESPSSQSTTSNQTDLTTIFNKYKEFGIREGGDESIDAIQPNGLISMCEDLSIDPYSDSLILIIAWLLGCSESYQISRNEFIDGFSKLRCNNLASIKKSEKEFRDRAENGWISFYNFCFDWVKPSTQRQLETEAAIELWTTLISNTRSWQHREDWFAFLTSSGKKAISKDVWQQFPELLKADLNTYDLDNGAWPVLFDEFVEKLRQPKGE